MKNACSTSIPAFGLPVASLISCTNGFVATGPVMYSSNGVSDGVVAGAFEGAESPESVR